MLILEPGAEGRPVSPAPATIDWPDFFASVSAQGVVFSDRLKGLEGRRVRLRGFSVARSPAQRGLLLTRIPYVESDPHGEGSELDLPYDVVGVVWRTSIGLPPVPGRPTVDGTLRLGNQEVGGQIVALALVDAVPSPPPPKS